MPQEVHLIDHPLVQHKLTLMRRKDASTNSFRRLLGELSAVEWPYHRHGRLPVRMVEL